MSVSIHTIGVAIAAFGMSAAVVVTPARGQVSLKQLEVQRPLASTAPAAAARTTTVFETLPEGTPVKVRLEDRLSSATSVVGDEFSISTDEAITLPDGAIIPAGFRGKGEVIEAHRKGMLGKAGTLAIRLDYIRIGDTRVHLRATISQEGKSGVTTTVVLTVLITPLFLMHHGAEVEIYKGTPITAYVEDDAKIAMPIPAPPQVD